MEGVMRIGVVGLGYVGLVTAACLAEWGHDVSGIEADERRLLELRNARLPFHEPDLDVLLARSLERGRLRVGGLDEIEPRVAESEVVILAVGTHDSNGGWQTETMRRALESVVPWLQRNGLLVIRSTLPPEFIVQLPALVAGLRGSASPDVSILLNPEFTQEGKAVSDFMRPSRVVCGVIHDPDGSGTQRLRELYSSADAPFLAMSGIDAAFAKLGANLFLATKISFANELAALCDAYGATIDHVVHAMSFDHRIGGSFLGAGIGFGGSCLPHQVTMTVKASRLAGTPAPLLTAVDIINRSQAARLVHRLEQMLPTGLQGQRVCLMGLAFKPHTDDMREAPSLAIARLLLEHSASVVAYDPMDRARHEAKLTIPGMDVMDDVFAALEDADAAVLVTEWPQLCALDWQAVARAMRGRIVVDGRNALDPAALSRVGLAYAGFGRGPRSAPASPRLLAREEEVVA
jgi:UDPglucose 6-dehydrogenase